MKKTGLLILTFMVMGLFLLSGCSSPTGQVDNAQKSGDGSTVKVAIPNLVDESGLMKELGPAFEKSSGYKIQVVAGTVPATIKTVQDGQADVGILVQKHVDASLLPDNHVLKAYPVMSLSMNLYGPAADPAGVKSLDMVAAFKKIAADQKAFISNRVAAAVYANEQNYWKSAGIQPSGDWYIVVEGDQLEQPFTVAEQKSAYVLSGSNSALQYAKLHKMELLVKGDPKTDEIVEVVAVNDQQHTTVNKAGAAAFVAWMQTAEAQKIISTVGVADHGQPHFNPVMPLN